MYPGFESSPYVAQGTGRRERWWYSDGIWLNQGETGDVVGFAWTHWLADRGEAVSIAGVVRPRRGGRP